MVISLPCRPALRRALLAGLTLALAGGCVEGTDGPVITGARPQPATPGQPLRIDGINFGASGHVAVGGRPVAERFRSADRVEVELPADLPPGPSWLVVVAEGRPSPAFAIDVAGDSEPRSDGARRFPPGLDGAVPDRGPSGDGGPGADAGGPLVAEFDPDPAGGDTVRLVARDAPVGRLILEVQVPDAPAVRGLALHLAYDRGLLRFAEASPRGGRALAVGEIGPGRLAIGRVLAGGDDPLVLTFDLVGPGEGRIDVPARHRTARDAVNRPLPTVDFAGGGVRVRRR